MPNKTAPPTSGLPHLKDFKRSLFWNLYDSVGTQGLLILYHILFRNFFGAQLHGRVGCTLSVFYLSLIVLNFGLDYSLAPFLEYFTQNKRSFTRFISWVIVPQLIILSLSATLFYLFFPQLQSLLPILKTFGPSVSTTFLLSICITFVLESLKKTAKYFLQLTFYTALTACVEVTGMALYIGSIMLMPFLGYPMTLEYTWQALCVISALQLLSLGTGVFRFYLKLKNESLKNEKEWEDLPGRIAKTRLFAWSNQCINQLFSGNFLVPICALHFGLEQASLMKVITSISYWITYLANKVFGITGNALLAHVKSRSLETQQKAFEYISFLLTQALYFLVIFLTINGKKIALLQVSAEASIQWPLLYFMLLISFFESLFIIYEKWYILEENASTFFLFNLVSFGALYALYPYSRSITALLTLIIALRLLTFFILTLFSFYKWRIWPVLAPDIRALLLAAALSAIFYALV